jgi:ribosome production factor 2
MIWNLSRTPKAWPLSARSSSLRYSHLGWLKRSSSKKRPDNLVFGRLYNHVVLDIFEAQVTAIEGNPELAFKNIDTTQRPVLLVFGDIFETKPELGRVRNFFNDLFGSNNQKKKIDVENSLNFVVTLTGYENQTFELAFHRYNKQLNKLDNLGVKLSMKLGRAQIAADDIFKEACKQPKLEKKTALRKVSEKSKVGEHLARVHVKQQDLKTLRLKKIKKRLPSAKPVSADQTNN